MIITSKLFKKPVVLFEDKKSLAFLNLSALTLLTQPSVQTNSPQIVGGVVGDAISEINTVGEVAIKGLEVIGTIGEYMANPTLILIDLWNLIHQLSYPILLSLALFSIFMYLLGHKSFGKYLTSSLVIFIIIQAIGRF